MSDVANAVIDGTDAVMLSGETAVGRYPEKVITAVERVCLAAERQPSTCISKHRVDRHFKWIDEAISMSAMYAANHLDIKAIVALTESGSTPLWMSRIRTATPIFGLSRYSSSLGKMSCIETFIRYFSMLPVSNGMKSSGKPSVYWSAGVC